ncbi:MAG: glycosyltransferase [Pseudomonadota bacterium]
MVQTKDSVLVLRVARLGRIPPALFSTQLIQESGLPVVVVEFGNIKEPQKFIKEPLTKLRIDAPWARFLPKKIQFPAIVAWVTLKLFFLFLVKGRPRILVAHGLVEQFVALLLSKIFWVPFVVHAHEIYNSSDVEGPFSQFLLKLEKLVFKSAQFSIFPEKKRAEIYRDRYRFKSPIFISANAPRIVSLPQRRDLRKAYQLNPQSVIMGYMGGIGPTNHFEIAIQALSFNPSVVFLAWGWGERQYLDQLQSLAHCLGVSERFIHLGQINEDKLETLAGCDFSYCVYQTQLLRAQHEVTASNKFFEAMAAGIPSLISSNIDFYQFNRKYPVGVCAPSLTTEGVSTAMKALVENISLRQTLGKNGRKLFETKFNYEHQFFKPAQAYQDLYFGYPEIWSFHEMYLPPDELPKAA